MDQLKTELEGGNYEFLQTVTDPYSLAAFLKKVIRDMGEPLCTFKGYEEFKSMGDEKDEERKIEMIRESFEHLP